MAGSLKDACDRFAKVRPDDVHLQVNEQVQQLMKFRVLVALDRRGFMRMGAVVLVHKMCTLNDLFERLVNLWVGIETALGIIVEQHFQKTTAKLSGRVSRRASHRSSQQRVLLSHTSIRDFHFIYSILQIKHFDVSVNKNYLKTAILDSSILLYI